MTATKTRRPRIATVRAQEVRVFRSELEARDDAGMAFVIEGTAAATNVSYDMGGYDEIVARGAFAATLAGAPDVQLLVNQEDLPLARTTIPPGQPGHLSLSENYDGSTSSHSWIGRTPTR